MAGNTFTQAFIIHRVVQNTTIAKSVLFLLDEDETDVISKIQDYGIKEYMINHYNQDNDIAIINDVFHRIISTFPQHYHSIVSYNNRSHYNNKFRNYKLLFKQNYLICSIFQYLDKIYPKSLIKCSLVDSIWLFNSFDPKSFAKLECNMAMSRLLRNNYYTSKHIWQRFRNIECLILFAHIRDPFDKNAFVNGLKSIRIEQLRRIHLVSYTPHMYTDVNVELTQMICSRLTCSNHLNSFCINIGTLQSSQSDGNNSDNNNSNNNDNNDSVSNVDVMRMNLRNCKKVCVTARPLKQYPMILEISNKCEHLYLCDECMIDKKSDFSGIKTLIFSSTQFKAIESSQDILNIARQCKNIKNISFHYPTFDMITFWEGINNYLIKNNAFIRLTVFDAVLLEEKCGIFRLIDENDWKIDELIIESIEDEENSQLITGTILTKKTIRQNVQELKLSF